MTEAYALLIAPFATYGFMRSALIACLALALANGPIGSLLLLRRMSLEGNVLSHAIMPGAALGYLYAGYSLLALTLGGLLTGVLVAGSAGFIARLRPQRKEASLAAFYLASLALGVMIVSARGSNADLMHVLFGTVLAVDVKALLFIAIVSSATLLIVAAIYRPLAVDSFDQSFLHVVGGSCWIFRGIFYLLLLLNLVASIQADPARTDAAGGAERPYPARVRGRGHLHQGSGNGSAEARQGKGQALEIEALEHAS